MKFKKIISLMLSLTLFLVFCPNVVAYSGHYNKVLKEKPEGHHTGIYKHDNILYKYSSTGEYIDKYSGWTTTEKGYKRYYIGGIQSKGWRKINNKWYYFRRNDGIMVTGEQKIHNQTYYFNEDGSWSRKYKKSAKKPEDFSVNLIVQSADAKHKYDIDFENKALVFYDLSESTQKELKKLSDADLQIIYSMIIDSDLTKVKEQITAYHIINNNLLSGYQPPIYNEDEDIPDDPAGFDYHWTDPICYEFFFTMNGNEYYISGDDTAFLYIDDDLTAMNFCQLVWFFYDLNENLK